MKNIIFLMSLFLFSCQEADHNKKNDATSSIDNTLKEEKPNISSEKKEEIKEKIIEKKETTEIKKPTTIIESEVVENFPWTTSDKSVSFIKNIPTPEGFTRVNYSENSFGDWLRNLPLKNKNKKVKYYNGGTKPHDVHEAIINIDVGNKDLQQCADAVMRLKAEYHYSRKEYEKIHFNYTSGDKVSFDDWRRGKKPIIKGNKVVFSSPSGSINNSYTNFKKYLIQIFSYAGTASLSKELKSIALKDIQAGDVFIQGGFPGHAVIVMDVAQNNNGDKIFMLAQSYMPAQDIHILKNNMSNNMSPWYSTSFENELNTPEWTFHRADLKRFP